MIASIKVWTIVISCLELVTSVQKFIEAPTYREVNPGGEVVLPCLVENKRGECRWEKDGTPVGMYENKYEWHGDMTKGDCSLKVREANIDYDNGVWQCQVTASDFTQRDTLISEGAELVVRGKNNLHLLLCCCTSNQHLHKTKTSESQEGRNSNKRNIIAENTSSFLS